MFEQSVIEQIGHYVYLLIDSRNNEVFYIGKGVNNRVFDHVKCALKTPENSDKIDRIREIHAAKKNVEHFIIRHGLTAESALETEAALIDFSNFAGIDSLTNQQTGYRSSDFGLRRSEELIAIYTAPPFQTTESVILININKRYKGATTDAELYEATRKSWILGKRREKARYVIPTYRGLTREVFTIDRWFAVGKRWGFEGCTADDSVRQALRFKSIVELTKKGAINPIRYVNCGF